MTQIESSERLQEPIENESVTAIHPVDETVEPTEEPDGLEDVEDQEAGEGEEEQEA